MSIYHLTVKIGSKDKGHSAGEKCAYITRSENYAKKADECAYTASGNMPKWPKTNPQKDPSHYWKAADIYERDNGRLYREVEFAIPRELNLDQQKALCHAFAERLATLDKGEKLPFTFAIHTDPENHNPHCHLIISERVNDGIPRNASTWFKRANPKEPKKGGAAKSQELKGKQWLEPTRQLWAQMANEAMKSGVADFNERTDGIDHRSNKARGLDALPTLHMGRACNDMMERGKPCQRGGLIAHQNEIRSAGNTFCQHYREPRTRIGRMVCQNFKRLSTQHYGGARKDGKPKTWQDIMRDIDRLIRDILKTSQQIAEQEIEIAKAQLERINEQIRVSKQVTDVLGFHDTPTSQPVAPRLTPAPPTAKPTPQPAQVAAEVKPAPTAPAHQPKPQALKRKPIAPRPPWVVDTSARG